MLSWCALWNAGCEREMQASPLNSEEAIGGINLLPEENKGQLRPEELPPVWRRERFGAVAPEWSQWGTKGTINSQSGCAFAIFCHLSPTNIANPPPSQFYSYFI